MRSLLVAALLAGWTVLEAQPVLFPRPLSPRIANYDIIARLDPKPHVLHCREKILWFNKTPDVISELRFHLYLNAFRNNRSTFMRESRGVSRISAPADSGWGYIDVKHITAANGTDLTGSLEFIHPDDNNTDDKSVARLPLPRPLAQGDSVILVVDFEDKLPDPPIARTGAKEEFLFAGQWFPKVGVYIDGKWNCHQFHATTEFFADFGVYNVNITVPEKNIVGGTGIEYGTKNNGDGTVTHFYHAEDVHDFAWTTSPEYIEFKGEKDNVAIRVLMQPDHAGQGERHVKAAQTAIDYFHRWYGTYPFPNLTVVDPRRGAGEVGGMEYPTLITGGTYYDMPEGIRAVENVIIHEFGHNYWYHLLASNEFEESWMDEGINSYTEYQIMNDAYGPTGDALDLLGIKMNIVQLHRSTYLNSANLDPTVRNGWQYYSSGSYGTNSYTKPALFLTTLQNTIGKDMMQKVMRAYVDRWSFKHPHSKDFVDVVNDVTGENFNDFFHQALFTNAVLDYSVDKVSTGRVGKAIGFDFTEKVDGPAPDSGSARDSAAAPDSAATLYASEVDVRRPGDFTFPVEMKATFANGDTVLEHWDGKDIWIKYKFTSHSRLVSATVDPYHKVVLDVNYNNNGRIVEPSSLGVTKTSIRILFWIQSLLDQPEWGHVATFFSGLF